MGKSVSWTFQASPFNRKMTNSKRRWSEVLHMLGERCPLLHFGVYHYRIWACRDLCQLCVAFVLLLVSPKGEFYGPMRSCKFMPWWHFLVALVAILTDGSFFARKKIRRDRIKRRDCIKRQLTETVCNSLEKCI